MKILIAEDDAISAIVLRSALQKLGHEVWMEPNGERAWELLRTQQFRLVMTDWMMPRLTGVDLTRRIRERTGQPYVYIILLSIKSSPEDRALAMAAGIDDFLIKPFDPADLMARVDVAERMIALKDQVSTVSTWSPSRPLGAPEIGSILVANGVITVKQLETALAEQLTNGRRIGEILCSHGWAGEDDVTRAFAEQIGLPYFAVRDRACAPDALSTITHAAAARYKMLPIDFNEDDKLRVAVENPFDLEGIALVERQAQCPLEIGVASPMALATAISEAYGAGGSTEWDLSASGSLA